MTGYSGGRRFLIVGALAWDRALMLDGPLAPGVRRLASPAAPKAAADGTRDGWAPGRLGGGAANASTALARAGLQAVAAGLAPEGEDGERIIAALGRAGVDTSCVSRRPGPAGATLILIDPDGERTIIGVRPPGPDATGAAAAAWSVSEFEHAWADVARRVELRFGDAPPAGVFLRATFPVGAAAPRTGVLVAHWSGRGPPPDAPHVVVSAGDLDEGEGRSAAQAAAADGRTVYMTLGAEGADVLESAGRQRVSTSARRVVDATGAGDVFAAGLLEALTAGASPIAAAAHGCVWGAAAASLPGSAPETAEATDFPLCRRP